MNVNKFIEQYKLNLMDSDSTHKRINSIILIDEEIAISNLKTDELKRNLLNEGFKEKEMIIIL